MPKQYTGFVWAMTYHIVRTNCPHVRSRDTIMNAMQICIRNYTVDVHSVHSIIIVNDILIVDNMMSELSTILDIPINSTFLLILQFKFATEMKK